MMNKCLKDVREIGKHSRALLELFNPNIGMTGSESMIFFFGGFVANLQPVETGLELSSTGSIVVSNLFVMAKLGKLDLQIHIKGIEGESLRSFSEGQSISLIRLFSENGNLTPIDAQKMRHSGNGIRPPLKPSCLRMRMWRQILDTKDMRGSGSMHQHRRVEKKLRFGHLGDSCMPSDAKINGIVFK